MSSWDSGGWGQREENGADDAPEADFNMANQSGLKSLVTPACACSDTIRWALSSGISLPLGRRRDVQESWRYMREMPRRVRPAGRDPEGEPNVTGKR